MRSLIKLVASLSPFLLAGCATVVTGIRQDIQVDSQPAGALCTFTRVGQRLGSVTTPGTLNIRRDVAPVTVVCTRDDYEEARAVLNAHQEKVTVANGVVPYAASTGRQIDHTSGAAWRYDASLRVELMPMSAADKAASASRRGAAQALAAGSAPAPASPSATASPATNTAAPTAPPPSQTGAWSARNQLIADRSAGTCSRDGGTYTLNLAGDRLTVANINGGMLTTTVPADGRIDQAFRSPSGARLTIVGNARMRELEIVNADGACRWKLTPAT